MTAGGSPRSPKRRASSLAVFCPWRTSRPVDRQSRGCSMEFCKAVEGPPPRGRRRGGRRGAAAEGAAAAEGPPPPRGRRAGARRAGARPLQQYCCNGTVATVLLQQYCCNSTVATVLLQQYCCNSTVATVLLQQYRCNSIVATVLLQRYCCNSTDQWSRYSFFKLIFTRRPAVPSRRRTVPRHGNI